MSDRDVKGISPEEWMKVWHVYDAAMEWWAAREDVIDATDDELCERAANRLTHARERLDLVLEDAHRRAKEGR